MSDADGGDSGETEGLRKALQFAVCQIIWDQDRKQGTRTTPDAISALTELAFQYATKSLIPDLYAFSTHANRKSTISPDDVALVLRKLSSDQSEAFKKDFCSGTGNKSAGMASKSRTGDSRKRSAVVRTAGRRSKRSETDVLPLTSSSSSSEEDAVGCKHNSKQKPVSVTHPSASAALRRSTARNISGARIGKQRESLLNKFRLPIANIFDIDDDSSSSSDDDSITKSPRKRNEQFSKFSGTSKPTSKLSHASPAASLQKLKKRQPSKPSGSDHYTVNRKKSANFMLLNDDDDGDKSTDGDEPFAKQKAKPLVNEKARHSISNPNDRKPIEDEDDDVSETCFGSPQKKIDGDEPVNHPRGKQSQVEEALANLSSDSGMDENDSEDEAVRIGKSAPGGHRRRPVIESDDDGD